MDTITRIRITRLLRGISSGELAASVGVSRTYLSRVEHGHVVASRDLEDRLLRALQLERDADDLRHVQPARTCDQAQPNRRLADRT